MGDSRRTSNGRYRDAQAILALCRLHWGQYRAVSELAADMKVAENTARDWLTWWRQTFAVHIERDYRGILEVVSSGSQDMGRLRGWMETGHAYDGAIHMGRPIAAGYKPWIDRAWEDDPTDAGSGAPLYMHPEQPRPLRPIPSARPAPVATAEDPNADVDPLGGL
jgi:hypothetical protein